MEIDLMLQFFVLGFQSLKEQLSEGLVSTEAS